VFCRIHALYVLWTQCLKSIAVNQYSQSFATDSVKFVVGMCNIMYAAECNFGSYRFSVWYILYCVVLWYGVCCVLCVVYCVSYRVISCRIISYIISYIVSYLILSYPTLTYHIIYIISYITSYHIVSYITSRHIILYNRIISYYTI